MKFATVDVFSDEPFRGNALGCFFVEEPIPTEQLHAIASWMNLSETIFVYPSKVANYRIRIFTTTVELPFAGHPTVGSGRIALEWGLLRSDATEWAIECGAGILRMKRSGTTIFIESPNPVDPVTIGVEELSKVSDKTFKWFDPLIIDNGPKWLVVRVEGEDIHEITFNLGLLKEILLDQSALGLTVYSFHPNGHEKYENAKVVSRSLFLENDIVEDAITGSANACIAHHLRKYLPIDFSSYTAFQGACLGRRGIVKVELKERVWVGGNANVVLSGRCDV